MNKLNRRFFLKTSATGAAGIAFLTSSKASDIANASLSGTKTQVITRNLGNTGLKIPVVSMGCGRVDSPAVVKAAMKVGINHFDTAYVYQQGNSEKMLGEALKDFPRDSFTVGTKIKPVATKEEFATMLDESLQRLQMDYVDILYLHAIKSKEEALNSEMVAALKKALEDGKAKYIGMSSHQNEPEVIQAAIDSDLYNVVLISYNFKQEHAKEIEEKLLEAKKRGIGIVAMKVMAGGFLDKDKTKPVNYKAAMKWALREDSVCTAIPSILNLEHLMDNAQVLTDLSLSDEDLKELELASAETGLYCNGCEECTTKCVKNLPIPDLMRAYMYAYGYGHSSKAKKLIAELQLNDNPCADCTSCEVKCVKGFNVSEKIADISSVTQVPDAFLS
ncbi:MAG: aldo/keto reductase [Bacteroidales bacterium]|nr:aldo/keto reductase [Bacteroidales bacterium]MBN2819770.1 aldo/keto reductase [Bacteroidales bacterium]